MARITFSTESALAKAAKTKAKSEKRSLSAYLSGLVENDLRAAGMIEGDLRAELLAGAEHIGIEKAVQLVRRAARNR